MKPPYELSSKILKLITSISQKIGAINARHITKQNPTLRKRNQIKTIHSSLQIEGNTLSIEQITDIVENKRVLGPEKDIKEVVNALEVYNRLKDFRYHSEQDFLKAHKMLMKGLVDHPGKYRTEGVGIVKGSKLEHVAPPHKNLQYLMKSLFAYLNDKTELTLIKSCVFHYEVEFIHPFIDGNGRMGRLWQTVILINEYPLFAFLPFESLIAKNPNGYYKALSRSDKEGKSTAFIEFMLERIMQALDELLENKSRRLSETDRLELFLDKYTKVFTRKDYIKYYSEISTATASRDLRKGVVDGLIEKFGDKKTTHYKKKHQR